MNTNDKAKELVNQIQKKENKFTENGQKKVIIDNGL